MRSEIYSIFTVLSSIIPWLNQNEGAMTALLTFVLIIVTIISTWQTQKMASVAKRQLDAENHPNLMVLPLAYGDNKLMISIYNHGKYPVYIRHFYLTEGEKLLRLVAYPYETFKDDLSKMEAFGNISHVHFLSSHNYKAFGAADLDVGSYCLSFSFHYGGTNA